MIETLLYLPCFYATSRLHVLLTTMDGVLGMLNQTYSILVELGLVDHFGVPVYLLDVFSNLSQLLIC